MMTHQIPPVLFLIFARPDTTDLVFEEIRKAKPSKLFIAADGPRKDKPGEKERCADALKILSRVDWDCEVKTLLRQENLGCGPALAGAITWFFEHVEEGIILEDDTKPSQEFFRYCAEMLEYYRDDDRVMSVSGSSLPNKVTAKSEYSYFFSDWDHVWGWATWRRAWKHYDYTMSHYPEVAERGLLLDNYTSIYERFHVEHMLQRGYYENGKVTWWDPQWGFARKINSGLVAVSTKNLVTNLGFGVEATNTTGMSQFADLEIEKLEFPLKHPAFVMRDKMIDNEIFRKYSTTPFSRLKGKIKYATPKWFYNFFKQFAKRAAELIILNNTIESFVQHQLEQFIFI